VEITVGVAGGCVRTGNSHDDTEGTAGCQDIGALKNGTLPGTRDCKGGTGPGRDIRCCRMVDAGGLEVIVEHACLVL